VGDGTWQAVGSAFAFATPTGTRPPLMLADANRTVLAAVEGPFAITVVTDQATSLPEPGDGVIWLGSTYLLDATTLATLGYTGQTRVASLTRFVWANGAWKNEAIDLPPVDAAPIFASDRYLLAAPVSKLGPQGAYFYDGQWTQLSAPMDGSITAFLRNGPGAMTAVAGDDLQAVVSTWSADAVDAHPFDYGLQSGTKPCPKQKGCAAAEGGSWVWCLTALAVSRLGARRSYRRRPDRYCRSDRATRRRSSCP
jgi:hypothetical protein